MTMFSYVITTVDFSVVIQRGIRLTQPIKIALNPTFHFGFGLHALEEILDSVRRLSPIQGAHVPSLLLLCCQEQTVGKENVTCDPTHAG